MRSSDSCAKPATWRRQPGPLLGDQRGEEFRLGKVRIAVLDVGRDILEQHSFAEFMLRTIHSVGEVRERLFRPRQREQVVAVQAAARCERDVLRDVHRTDAAAEVADAAHVGEVERLDAA